MPQYTKDKFEVLKSKFNRSNEINENNSQAYQDMFILETPNPKILPHQLNNHISA